MSQPDVSSQGWDRFKNAIRGLYIVKGHKLEGKDGVISLMESQHGFKATKAQYEKKFKEWGFQKNHSKDEWTVVAQKIKSRKRTTKESNVYLNGELLPRKRLQKEISRQGFMTFAEQFNKAEEMTPETPPGFDIRTPAAQAVFRLVFENLPILRFQEMIPPLAASIQSIETDLTALVPFLGKSLQTDANCSKLPIIESLLPNSAFLQEACAEGLAIERLENFGPVQFLNLATFMLSNNFPGETDGEQVYKWLKSSGSRAVIKVIASKKGPTGEALLETLFRLAIEAEDLPTVKLLLEAGVNPNGHICQHPQIPAHMNPLQRALIRGNTEIALELIKAGSTIDQPGTGWKSSALVLAIIGEYLRGCEDFWQPEDYSVSYQAEMDPKTREPGSGTAFLDLISHLIDAGAAVNPIVDQSSPSWRAWKDQYLDSRLDSLIKDGHSPLTAASKYRNKELVYFFLQNGADVEFLTNRQRTALCECLCSWEELQFLTTDDASSTNGVLFESVPTVPFSDTQSEALGVARLLVNAGAPINERFLWCRQMEGEDYDHMHDQENGCFLTTLDLSVLTGNPELVDLMLSAGASAMTVNSLELAITLGNFVNSKIVDALLVASAPLSSRAVKYAIIKDENLKYIKTLHRKRPDVKTSKTMLVEAVKLGKTSLLEYLLDSGDSVGRDFICELLDGIVPAIETCCANGHLDTLCLILDKCSQLDMSILLDLGGAIFEAVSCGHHKIVEALLSAGVEASYAQYGETALIVAIKRKLREMALKLVDANSPLSTQTKADTPGIVSIPCVKYHETAGDALVMAIEWGNDIVVERLLAAGAGIDTLGHSQRLWDYCRCITPVTAAIISRNLQLVNTLISRGAAINNPPGSASTSMTPLAAAIRIKHHLLVDHLIQMGANPFDSSALDEAASDAKLLHVLLKAWRKGGQKNDVKPLGNGAFVRLMKENNLDTIQSFLITLARLDLTESLSIALINSLRHDCSPNLDVLKMVLQHGANPNDLLRFFREEHDEYYKSALCVAIEETSFEKVEVLLEAGAKPDEHLSRGMYSSALQFAASCQRMDIVRILLVYGANPNAVSSPQKKRRSFMDKPERDNGTPIQIAVCKGDTGIVKLLLQHKVDVNKTFGNMPHTALQMASRDGNKEIVELLLNHGAKVNAPPARDHGATALQFAAIKGLLGIAHLLLEYEADVNSPPAEIDGRTALEGAAEHGRIDMVQLLLNAGAKIFDDGETQYQNAVRRASENGHHAIRRLFESYHG